MTFQVGGLCGDVETAIPLGLSWDPDMQNAGYNSRFLLMPASVGEMVEVLVPSLRHRMVRYFCGSAFR